MWHQLNGPADIADVEAVVDLARAREPRCGRVRVIAIDGPSGSGKTTLAAGVCATLDAPAAHMDLIFPGWDGLRDAVGLLTSQVLEPLSRGETAAHRVWDWERGEWGAVRAIPDSDVVVVEGCGASVMPAGRYAAVAVWVEAPPDVRMARGLERDGETFRPHWQRWAAQEQALFAADGTKARADIVISTDPAGLA